jgi:hypothetical protein
MLLDKTWSDKIWVDKNPRNNSANSRPVANINTSKMYKRLTSIKLELLFCGAIICPPPLNANLKNITQQNSCNHETFANFVNGAMVYFWYCNLQFRNAFLFRLVTFLVNWLQQSGNLATRRKTTRLKITEFKTPSTLVLQKRVFKKI